MFDELKNELKNSLSLLTTWELQSILCSWRTWEETGNEYDENIFYADLKTATDCRWLAVEIILDYVLGEIEKVECCIERNLRAFALLTSNIDESGEFIICPFGHYSVAINLNANKLI